MRSPLVFYLLLIAAFAASAEPLWIPNNYLDAEKWHYLRMMQTYPGNTSFLPMQVNVAPSVEIAPGHQTGARYYSLSYMRPYNWYHAFAIKWDAMTSTVFPLPLQKADGMIGWDAASVKLHYLTLSYAVSVIGNLNLGVDLRTAFYFPDADISWIFNPRPGLDLSASWRITNHPFWGVHVVGLSVHNLLEQPAKRGESIGRFVRGTWHSSLLLDRIKTWIDVDAVRQITYIRNGDLRTDNFFGRISISNETRILGILKGSGRIGFSTRGIESIGTGVGIDLAEHNRGNALDISYQITKVYDQTDDFFSAIRVRAEFGAAYECTFPSCQDCPYIPHKEPDPRLEGMKAAEICIEGKDVHLISNALWNCRYDKETGLAVRPVFPMIGLYSHWGCLPECRKSYRSGFNERIRSYYKINPTTVFSKKRWLGTIDDYAGFLRNAASEHSLVSPGDTVKLDGYSFSLGSGDSGASVLNVVNDERSYSDSFIVILPPSYGMAEKTLIHPVGGGSFLYFARQYYRGRKHSQVFLVDIVNKACLYRGAYF